MIKTNIKMRVTPEQSVKVQEICFNRGFEWASGENKAIYINEPFIIISSEKDIRWIGKDRESVFIEAKEEEIDPELFIRTNGSCVEKEEFNYPMWFKHKNLGHIVRFDGLTVGEVVYGFENWLPDYAKSDNWTEHTDDSGWVQVPNPDLVTDIDNNKAKNPNSKHYELWENFEAIDVIKLALTDEEYKGFLKGNILKYRLRAGKKNIENDNIIKDINKSIDYERELNK